MRTSFFALVAVSAVALAIGQAGCGNSTTDTFGSPTSAAPTSPVGTATQPSIATFTTDVNPFLTSQGCGISGCHMTPGVGDTKAYTVGTDSAGNFAQTVCNPRLTTYGASPAGTILSKFCASKTTAGGGHQGKVATNANCTAFYNWAGEGNGAPPTCP